MPAPTTVGEFLELIQKSGVLEDARLNSYTQQLQAAGSVPSDPKKLAGLMVRDGMLTYFQAEQFLQGKWKRFTIGRYKVLERLGSGGMGQVFLCEHKLMRRRVAVKVLPTAKAEDQSALERFYREARAVAALDHVNIVRAYDIDQDDNLHFLVMEYVDGSSLQDVVKKLGPMDVLRCCHYIYQAAIGLQHAHESAGLVHRDIKPGNLLIDRFGTVKILDMGLARFFHDEEDLLTKKYDESVLGTADYLAPEQAIDSHSVDIRADIYSLGATFYFMLTGNPPFAEGTVAQKLIWHQTRQPRPIKQLRPDVPDGVVEIINRMMVKDPAQRYQTPYEVAEALQPWVQTPIAAPPETEMPQLSPAAMAAGGGATPAAPAIGGPPRTGPIRPASRTGSLSQIQLPPPPAPSVPLSPQVGSAPTSDPSSPPAYNGSTRPGTAVAPAPTVSGKATEELNPFWESLSSEMPVPAASAEAPRPVPTSTPSRSSRKGLLIASVATAGVLAVGAVAAILLGKSTSDPGKDGSQTTQGTEPGRLEVGKQGHPFRTVQEALEKAKPGDTVVIMDASHEEQLRIDGKRVNKDYSGVTVTGSLPDRGVAWKLPAKRNSLYGIIELNNVNGLKITGLTLDGSISDPRPDTLVKVVGVCPGLTLADLTIRNYHRAAVKFSNGGGDEGRPFVLENVQIIGMPPPVSGNPTSAIEFLVTPKVIPAACQHISVRDCRIEGGHIAVAVNGPIEGVEIVRTRVYRSQDGIVIRKSTGPAPTLGLTISRNTFFGSPGSILVFDGPISGSNMQVDHNLFVGDEQTTTTARFGPGVPQPPLAPGTGENMMSNESKIRDTYPGLKVKPINFVLPSSDPKDDAKFLRVPKGSPPDQAGVGVPPA